MLLGKDFRKSSRSSGNGNCTEVAIEGGVVMVRNSKNPNAGTTFLNPQAWREFILGVKDNEFQL